MQPSLASKLRMALVMTVAVYPVVTLYLYILMPLTTGWDIWQRSLVLVPFMATTIVHAGRAVHRQAFRRVYRRQEEDRGGGGLMPRHDRGLRPSPYRIRGKPQGFDHEGMVH